MPQIIIIALLFFFSLFYAYTERNPKVVYINAGPELSTEPAPTPGQNPPPETIQVPTSVQEPEPTPFPESDQSMEPEYTPPADSALIPDESTGNEPPGNDIPDFFQESDHFISPEHDCAPGPGSQPVPEPATIFLLGPALAGLWARRNRTRS